MLVALFVKQIFCIVIAKYPKILLYLWVNSAIIPYKVALDVKAKKINETVKMNQKTHRLSVIRKIIRSEYISSQEELIARLEECGVTVTQSTLSRDLKFMNVAKVPNKERGYIYVLPSMPHNEHAVSNNIVDNITDIAFSGNMCVITTKSGYASAISVPIDNKGISEVLGSIAGDNTILLILREGYRRDVLLEQLCEIFPSLSLIIAR